MRISFKPYVKKNGELMFYINNDRKVSIGGTNLGFGPSTKWTDGQKKLLEAAAKVLNLHGQEFTGDMANHVGAKISASHLYTFVEVVNGTLGGQPVGGDGFYIVGDGKFLEATSWYEVD